MRILQLTIGFLPALAWGGPVRIVHQNSTELAHRGHEVTVYCSNLLDKTEKIQPETFEREVDGLRVVYLDARRLPAWSGTLGPLWMPDLGGYLRRELGSYDIVHINGYRNLAPLTVARAARRAGVPYVVQPHGGIPAIINVRLLKRIYDRMLSKQVLEGLGALIAGQPSEREQALSAGVPDEYIVEIPNGLVPPDLDAIPAPDLFRERFDLPLEEPVILFLGRINRKKGTDMLVEAFALMPEPRPLLVFAGPDDGQLAEVKELVRQYDLESRVRFTGLLRGSDVWAAYRDADLFVLPCRTDTFPMAIIEACAMGTPVLTTAACEIAHLVSGKFGEAVPFDAEQFAVAMERLLDNGELRQSYSANSRRIMEQEFSMRAVGDKLERVYAAAIEGVSPGQVGL